MNLELNDLHSLRKVKNETETEFSSRLISSSYFQWNIFNDGDEMNLYLDGLIPKIRTVAARFSEDQLLCTLSFDNLVQYAPDEDESCRAWITINVAGSRPVLKTVTKNGLTVTFK